MQCFLFKVLAMSYSSCTTDEHYSPTSPPEGLNDFTASSVYNNSFSNDTALDEPAFNEVYDIINRIGMYTAFVLCPTGFILNLVSVVIFVKSKIARTSVGLHMVFLAIADNLVLVSGFIDGTSVWQFLINIPDLCALTSFTCSASNYFHGVGLTWSGILLASSTIERFMAVALPLRVKAWNLYKKSKVLMGLYLMLCIVICSHGWFCDDAVTLYKGNVCSIGIIIVNLFFVFGNRPFITDFIHMYV